MTNQGSQQWFVIVSQDSNIGAKKGAKPLPRSPGLALRWKRRRLLFTRHAGNCIVHQTMVKASDKQVWLVVEPPYIPQMSDIIICMLIHFIYLHAVIMYVCDVVWCLIWSEYQSMKKLWYGQLGSSSESHLLHGRNMKHIWSSRERAGHMSDVGRCEIALICVTSTAGWRFAWAFGPR